VQTWVLGGDNVVKQYGRIAKSAAMKIKKWRACTVPIIMAALELPCEFSAGLLTGGGCYVPREANHEWMVHVPVHGTAAKELSGIPSSAGKAIVECKLLAPTSTADVSSECVEVLPLSAECRRQGRLCSLPLASFLSCAATACSSYFDGGAPQSPVVCACCPAAVPSRSEASTLPAARERLPASGPAPASSCRALRTDRDRRGVHGCKVFKCACE
jgi:hypothetical protein